MPGLSIIVAADDARCLYAALETAMASAALGRPARLFLQGDAAALLRAPVRFAGDAPRRAAGQPTLAQMVEEAAAMDVALIVCQSGLALTGTAAGELVSQAQAGGLVSFLAGLGPEDSLVVY